jgi:hypothetical protein
MFCLFKTAIEGLVGSICLLYHAKFAIFGNLADLGDLSSTSHKISESRHCSFHDPQGPGSVALTCLSFQVEKSI